MSIKCRIGILILFIAVAGATVLYAAEETSTVNLTVGRSTVIDVGVPIARVSLTSPDVADALVTSSAQLLVHGKTPGTISMFIWDRAGAIRRYDVTVQRDLSRLVSQMAELFPGEHLSVQGNGRSVIVSGKATTKFVADKALEVAAGYVEKKDDVVNLVQIGGANGPAQVLLRVRFAEVSRTALTELGASWFTSPTGVKSTLARVTTQQFAAPGFDELKWTKESGDFGAPVTGAQGKFTFSDFLNLFVFSEKYDLGAMVRLLQNKGVFQNLAEPNLVTESGKEASFLAGGEIPVPVAQGTGGNVAISVQWKEFGIRLSFTPTVNDDRVHLKVKPEVSTLDFANAITLQGFRIPALSTRRADTEIELRNGQTFAIAGLLNNTATQTLQKVPGIGDIPILGLLFKSKAAQKQQTELVVMITPEILSATSRGITGDLPRLVEPYMTPPAPKKTFPSPPPAFPSGRSGSTNVIPPPVAGVAPAPGAAGDPATAGAPVVVAPQGQTVIGDGPTPTQAGNSVATPPSRKAEAQALERAQREERDRSRVDKRAKGEQSKRDAKLAEEQRRAQRYEEERQAKLAREQAKRDAEQAKRQAELDRQRQKQIDEAAAKLKAAEQAYQAELAKRSTPPAGESK
jgi:pilus assembly protein CpaC